MNSSKGLSLKTLALKKILHKHDKEHIILIGLVDLYIKTGSAVGSNVLKEKGFDNMSSATIRNYFAKLEKKGFLTQQHTSGGRIPTSKAYRAYIDHYMDKDMIDKKDHEALSKALQSEKKEIAKYLTDAADTLSDLTKCPVFQSSPRFDQDFIRRIKLIKLDKSTLLFVIITDFGLIKTEKVHSTKDLSDDEIKLIEDFFIWKMNKIDKPEFENQSLAKLAQHFYNEIMVRYIAGYSTFISEDIHKTGLSHLLNFPEFSDPITLAEALSILENPKALQKILRKCCQENKLLCFTAEELKELGLDVEDLSVICIPYKINETNVGATAIIGPMRLNYKQLFSVAQRFSSLVSDALTKSIYKFKISFRQPHASADQNITDYNRSILLEDKSRDIKEK